MQIKVNEPPKVHPGDCNDISRKRVDSRSQPYTDEGRDNFDDIDFSKAPWRNK